MRSNILLLTAVAVIAGIFLTACAGRDLRIADMNDIGADLPLPIAEPETIRVLSMPDPRVPQHPSRIRFDSLDWKVPVGDPFRTTLKNGIVAYVAVDSSLPLVNIEAYIRSGALNDPAGKEGLGALMSRLLRVGGTAQYPADTLDMLADLLAIKLSFSQTEAHINFEGAFLSEYTDTAMHIIKQMMFHPSFEQRRVDRERSMMIENVRNRFANPGPTLSFAFRKHNYPKTAASRMNSEASLNGIKRNDLVALHRAAFGGAADMIVSVSGKFDREEMIAKLNKLFDLEMKADSAKFPDIDIAPLTDALVVHRSGTQAHIRMGLPLFKRPHPDYYPVALMNYILGGSGFISRLGTRVRSDEGLTYSIYSRAESNYTYDGTLFVEFFTDTENYPKAITIILEEMKKVISDGVTESELENARSALISELPSSFRSPEDIVSTYAWNEFYGRAPDHYVKYPDELRNVSAEAVKAAAEKYIDVNRITYTIVGDTAAINAASSAAAENGFFSIDSLKRKLVITANSIVTLP